MLTETVMLPRSAAAAGPSAPDVEETPAEAAPEPDATACAEPPSEPAETDDARPTATSSPEGSRGASPLAAEKDTSPKAAKHSESMA